RAARAERQGRDRPAAAGGRRDRRRLRDRVADRALPRAAAAAGTRPSADRSTAGPGGAPGQGVGADHGRHRAVLTCALLAHVGTVTADAAPLLPRDVAVRLAHAAVQAIADEAGITVLHIKGP